MSEKTGGPAFPSFEDEHYYQMGYKVKRIDTQGMTLRDYFAGKALVGLFSWMPNTGEEISFDANELAANAYKVAAAMIVERAK